MSCSGLAHRSKVVQLELVLVLESYRISASTSTKAGGVNQSLGSSAVTNTPKYCSVDLIEKLMSSYTIIWK